MAKGKGWTPERRKAQAERIKAAHARKVEQTEVKSKATQQEITQAHVMLLRTKAREYQHLATMRSDGSDYALFWLFEGLCNYVLKNMKGGA